MFFCLVLQKLFFLVLLLYEKKKKTTLHDDSHADEDRSLFPLLDRLEGYARVATRLDRLNLKNGLNVSPNSISIAILPTPTHHPDTAVPLSTCLERFK